MGLYSNYITESKTIGKKSKYLGYPLTDSKIAGQNISIQTSKNEIDDKTLEMLDKDLPIMKSKYNEILSNDFINWLKEADNSCKLSNKEIIDKIELYEVTYHYAHICQKYSPNGKDDYFGEFSFSYRPKNIEAKKELNNLFDAAEFIVYIKDNKIVKIECNDI